MNTEQPKQPESVYLTEHAGQAATGREDAAGVQEDVAEGHCDCGERCSCQPGSDARASCNCWHEGEATPIKVYGVLVLEKSQKPLIEKHCFGDCGKISMAGAIHDELLGGLMVCCEETCPWLLKQMDKTGEPYGTTMSFGRPHEVFLRTLTDTPAKTASPQTGAAS